MFAIKVRPVAAETWLSLPLEINLTYEVSVNGKGQKRWRSHETV